MSNKPLTLTATISDRLNTFSFAYEWETTIAEDAPISHAGLLQKGFGETLRDKFSTYKVREKSADGSNIDRDATPQEKDAFTRGKLEDIKEGRYAFGGGGSRGMSDEDHAMKAVLMAAGIKWVKAQKATKDTPAVVATTIESALHDYAVALARQQNQDFTPELVEEVRTMAKESPLYTTTIENRVAARKLAEQAKKADGLTTIKL